MTPTPEPDAANQLWLTIAIIVGFPFVFGLFWCGIVSMLSFGGGWHRVAKRFPRQRQPQGKRYGSGSGAFGGVNYNGCLIVHASAEGLDIHVWPMFRIAHPPIFLPWTEINNPKPIGFFLSYIRFKAGSPSAGTITLQAKVFEQMPAEPPAS
jgi:hypothetical protein